MKRRGEEEGVGNTEAGPDGSSTKKIRKKSGQKMKKKQRGLNGNDDIFLK